MSHLTLFFIVSDKGHRKCKGTAFTQLAFKVNFAVLCFYHFAHNGKT